MKSLMIFITLNVFIFNILISQSYTISGYVEDASTGERLIGCIVKDANNDR